MSVSVSKNNDVVTIVITQERFDYKLHNDFLNAYQKIKCSKYVIDLANVVYMDSAAFGSLLLLRKQAGNTKECVTLINCKKDILNILKIMKYDERFTYR